MHIKIVNRVRTIQTRDKKTESIYSITVFIDNTDFKISTV